MASWKDQWFTLRGAFVSRNAVLTKDEVVAILKPIVKKDWQTSQLPSVAYLTETVAVVFVGGDEYSAVAVTVDGPYATKEPGDVYPTPSQLKAVNAEFKANGEPTTPYKQYVTLFKWNLRTRDGTAAVKHEGDLRAALRAAKPGGSEFVFSVRADKGLPPTPAIPPRPTPEEQVVSTPDEVEKKKTPWGLILAGLLAAAAAAKG